MDKAFFAANEVCCAYLTGHMDDARQALDHAGDAMDLKVIEAFGLDAESMIGRTYATTGPLKASAEAMQKAITDGKTAEAAKVCREVLAKLDKTDKARTFLRNRGAVLEIEARFASGEWVNIQPEADLAGWKPARGQWSVDAGGGLVGRLDPRGLDPHDERGPMLFCQARVGPRFELRGHAEILEPKDKSPGFGAIIAYRDAKNYWQCLFHPYDPTTHHGNAAWILCSLHRNPHARPMVVKRSDDFRVLVYDGQVATTIGVPKEPDQVPYVLELEHDPPDETTPVGVGASRGWFTDPPVSVRSRS
jgi:hypothetical protein